MLLDADVMRENYFITGGTVETPDVVERAMSMPLVPMCILRDVSMEM